MPRIRDHLRRTFLTGIFAFVPLVVTAYIIYWIDAKTALIPQLFGFHIPIVGLLATVIFVYLIGLVATLTAGQVILGWLDTLLSKMPILRPVYTAWKQVALTPGGTEGVFSHIVLVPETENLWMIGFTSLRPVPGDPESICVLIFNAPTPTTGRMYFIRRDKCRELDLSAEEAFKIILSAGNYIPPQIGAAIGQNVSAETMLLG